MNSPDAIVVGAGQAGLAAARSLLACGLKPLVLEAGPEPVGYWAAAVHPRRRPAPIPMLRSRAQVTARRIHDRDLRLHSASPAFADVEAIVRFVLR